MMGTIPLNAVVCCGWWLLVLCACACVRIAYRITENTQHTAVTHFVFQKAKPKTEKKRGKKLKNQAESAEDLCGES
jgi:hypothetical protein